MDSEYTSLVENKTWILVPRPENKKVLSNRWVFKTKFNQKGEIQKFKARLVVRGHTQREGIDYEEVFAPVSRYETIRTLLAASVNEEMHVHQMDVVSAYTQGELSDEVYMEQPEMYAQKGEEKVCKLLRPLYGLKQSGREWYKTFDKYVTNNGGKRTMADPCLYVFDECHDQVIMLIYVDDLILASKKVENLERVKSKLKSAFKMVDLGPIHDILGIGVERQGLTGSICLSQKKYIKELVAKFNMEDAKPTSTPMETNMKITKEMSPKSEDERAEMKKRPYRELVGGLIYLANATRPDIAFAAGTLSRFCTDPGEVHWSLAKRVLRYLTGTSHYNIKYIKNKNDALAAYTDSDWAGDVDDRKSCTGNVIMLANGPISWKSKKQASVALSTMEAEYAALAEMSREIIYVKRLLTYMGFEKFVKDSINVYCDNQSAIELSKNAVFHKRSKHIDISFHFTRELIEKKVITIQYLRTELMIADIFTKSLSRDKHHKCISMLQLE